MGLLDNVLSRIGFTRYADGSVYYSIKKNNPSFISGVDKLDIALNNPVVAACIEIRAKLLSKAVFFIEDDKGDRIVDDEVIKLINNPNIHQSKQDFIKQYEWYKSAYGWVYQKPYGSIGFTPDAIFNLKTSNIEFPKKMLPSMVFSKKESDAFYEQTFQYKEGNTKKSIQFKEVIPFYDLTNGLQDGETSFIVSKSKIDSVIKQISNIGLASEAENVMIQTNGREIFSGGNTKGANSGGIMPMHVDDKEQVETKLIRSYGFGYGKRRSIATNNAVNWQSLHIKLQELGLHESITNNANIVRETFEVPNELYKAFMKGATFENQKEALIGFIQNTIQPIADDLASSWTTYFGYEDKPIKASFDHLPVMQHTEDKKADKMLKIATAFEKLTRAGLTQEEVTGLFESQGITITDEEVD